MLPVMLRNLPGGSPNLMGFDPDLRGLEGDEEGVQAVQMKAVAAGGTIMALGPARAPAFGGRVQLLRGLRPAKEMENVGHG